MRRGDLCFDISAGRFDKLGGRLPDERLISAAVNRVIMHMVVISAVIFSTPLKI